MTWGKSHEPFFIHQGRAQLWPRAVRAMAVPLYLLPSASPAREPSWRPAPLRCPQQPSAADPRGRPSVRRVGKKHSDAKHAKNYFTDKQQRTGFVSGAELVIYLYKHIIEREGMAEIHSLIDPNKITVCFFYCLPHPPALCGLRLLPLASASSPLPARPPESTNCR